MVLLFTDGLVEGPSRSLDDGLARLAEAAGAGYKRGLGVEDVADLVLRELVGPGGVDDDIALLVFSNVEPFVDHTVELAGDPSAVRTARRLAEAAAADLAEPTLVSLRLLVSEVVTNAIRHTGSAVRLRVRATRFRVRVEVFDERPGVGEVRPSTPDDSLADRGRGLHLVEQFADRWGVEPTSTGKCVWFEVSSPGVES